MIPPPSGDAEVRCIECGLEQKASNRLCSRCSFPLPQKARRAVEPVPSSAAEPPSTLAAASAPSPPAIPATEVPGESPSPVASAPGRAPFVPVVLDETPVGPWDPGYGDLAQCRGVVRAASFVLYAHAAMLLVSILGMGRGTVPMSILLPVAVNALLGSLLFRGEASVRRWIFVRAAVGAGLLGVYYSGTGNWGAFFAEILCDIAVVALLIGEGSRAKAACCTLLGFAGIALLALLAFRVPLPGVARPAAPEASVPSEREPKVSQEVLERRLVTAERMEEAGKHADAARELERLLADAGNGSAPADLLEEARYVLARCHLHLGENGKALAILDSLGTRRGLYVYPYAVALSRAGRTADAERVLQEAIDTGMLPEELERFQRSLEMLRMGLSLPWP